MTNPNYAVAPGEYLEEWIDDHGLSQAQAAAQLGCSRKQVNEIVNGRAPLTADTALRLERVVGIPAATWLRYEAAYRADRARLEDEERLAQHVGDIDPVAATYLRSIRATTATKREPGKLVSDFLAFHRVGTWTAFTHMHDSATRGDYALAALTESKANIDRTVLSVWLRAAELTESYEAARSYNYDPERLRAALPNLRARASTPDESMLGDISRMLAEVGVAFMIVEPPAKFPLLGMTRWIDERVPVIQQTGRRAKDGFVIWTLFHELGHVLNDPRGEMHLEYSTEKKRTSAAEKGANAFAMSTLFGAEGIEPFRGLTADADIRSAARRQGVAPGVAVHQLHRRRMLDYGWGNRLCVDLSGSFDA
jgi:HTH-type transcriptional regulator/antitoxin HigA